MNPELIPFPTASTNTSLHSILSFHDTIIIHEEEGTATTFLSVYHTTNTCRSTFAEKERRFEDFALKKKKQTKNLAC